eukprot:TRINITY_DN66471_c0_g1_i1.p2 TRINITY_DN66471_c0_g1~~TRINITY_DN66471_c0_g1_i1.p2  ORF type:complete len:280 (+),score=113.43 TRINITY_DN66471_c0_g1_i1:86-841(+)
MAQPELPDSKELEKEVIQNVRQMRDEGMRQVYLERMKKLRGEVEKTGLFRDGIYPDFTPQQFVQFAWGEGDTETVALNGNPLAAKDVQGKPAYLFEAHTGIKYCLIAFDADAEGGPYLLWARMGIEEGDAQYASGRDWFRWQPPTPAKGTGPHRIFFMLFHQKEAVDQGRLKTISKFSREGRARFSPKAFAQKFGFEIVVGCNSFITQWDESVERTAGSLKDEVAMDENSKKTDPCANPCEGTWDYRSQEP